MDVYRVAEDGLSREAWQFGFSGGNDTTVLVLRSYGIERRKAARGRFARARESWNSMDERSYYLSLPRPAEIPDDVVREAIGMVRIGVNIGWTTLGSQVAEYGITAV